MIDRKWIGHELPPSMLAIERSRLQFSPRHRRNPAGVSGLAAARARDTATSRHRDLSDGGGTDRAYPLNCWPIADPLAKLLHGEQSSPITDRFVRADTVTVRSKISEIYRQEKWCARFVRETSRAVNQREELVAELRSRS